MDSKIRDFILRDATVEDINQIVDLVKQRRNAIARMNTMSLRRGTNVSFISSRRGTKVMGTVEDIKIKNVIVNTAYGRYRVPASMLTVEV